MAALPARFLPFLLIAIAMPSTATPLTAEQTQQLRTQLLQRQEQLLQELNEVKRATLAQLPNQGDAGHPDDRKEHTEGMFFNRVRDAEAARDHDELVAVRAALARLDEGSYGECTDCGKDVGWPRLHAQPQAARCLGCQTKAEARH